LYLTLDGALTVEKALTVDHTFLAGMDVTAMLMLLLLPLLTGVLVVKLCRINLRSNLFSSSASFAATLLYILYIPHTLCKKNIAITTGENNSRSATP
jgi:hypothetical protein